jgi:hypothetical protein
MSGGTIYGNGAAYSRARDGAYCYGAGTRSSAILDTTNKTIVNGAAL